MIRFTLHPYEWQVKVYYLDLPDTDYTDIEDSLKAIGYDGKHPAPLTDIVDGINMGMTYSDTRSRRTVIVIGRTTSADECADTIIHERLHLAMHICKTLHIDPFSEQSAYLSGDIGKRMYKSASMLLCNDCRHKLRHHLKNDERVRE